MVVEPVALALKFRFRCSKRLLGQSVCHFKVTAFTEAPNAERRRDSLWGLRASLFTTKAGAHQHALPGPLGDFWRMDERRYLPEMR